VPLGVFAIVLVVEFDEACCFFEGFWASAAERLRRTLQTMMRVSGFMFIGILAFLNAYTLKHQSPT